MRHILTSYRDPSITRERGSHTYYELFSQNVLIAKTSLTNTNIHARLYMHALLVRPLQLNILFLGLTLAPDRVGRSAYK